jgi:molybdate transport system regulatory protein
LDLGFSLGPECSKIQSMKVKVRVSITNAKGEGYMGIGLVWLLKKIQKFKSIRLAAMDMELSYTKALTILNRLEKNLGQKVLVRTRGGMVRGGAELTPFAEAYIKAYEDFADDVSDYAKRRFKGFRKTAAKI